MSCRPSSSTRAKSDDVIWDRMKLDSSLKRKREKLEEKKRIVTRANKTKYPDVSREGTLFEGDIQRDIKVFRQERLRTHTPQTTCGEDYIFIRCVMENVEAECWEHTLSARRKKNNMRGPYFQPVSELWRGVHQGSPLSVRLYRCSGDRFWKIYEPDMFRGFGIVSPLKTKIITTARNKQVRTQSELCARF